jgi:NAD(P)-dependent dehydrogenase (short-subunit alcohol dehydrogenase family)
VITGANSGIGFETAMALARRNATIVLACRNPARARAAEARIVATAPGATIEHVRLDLADLTSVREAASDLRRRYSRLDLLINNAGIAWPPYAVTTQGVELQLATNHIGHFALTGHLIAVLLDTPGSRVVSLSSLAHWLGRLRLDDLASDRGYRPFRDYARSKLATLMFTYELQRRLAAVGAGTVALAAHPGGSRSELLREPLALSGMRLDVSVLRSVAQPQSAAMGALATLRAAVDRAARGGDYIGPGGLLEVRGLPATAKASRRARDRSAQQQLWDVSEQVSGVHYLGRTG